MSSRQFKSGIILVGGCLAALFAATTQPTRAAAGLPRPDHLVIVIEENHSFQEIYNSASAPLINSLVPEGALFTQSFAVEHPSEPNYLDLFSGSNQGVRDDSCPHSFSTANLGAQLFAAALSFGGYSEDLPAVGSTVCTSGNYARKHNPWVNFNTAPNAVPPSANKPFAGNWPTTATGFAELPTVSIVVPNLVNDMHDGSISQGDAWFWSNLSGYYQWAKTHNSLLILTFDEDDSSASNQIFTLFVGPMVKPGLYADRIDHFNVLRTTEDMYGLGHAGAAATATPITVAWTTSVPGASTLSAQAGDGQVSLSWTAVGGAQSYTLYRGTAPNGETQLTSGVSGASYLDRAVTNGTTYYYKVTAVNVNGEGPPSNEVNATPNAAPVPPAAPSNLNATGGNQRVTLSWVDNTTDATGIAIERTSNLNKAFAQIATVAPAAASYVDSGLRRKATYYYRIRAVNGNLVSGYSNIANATTLR
jgi:hypothetical protein